MPFKNSISIEVAQSGNVTEFYLFADFLFDLADFSERGGAGKWGRVCNWQNPLGLIGTFYPDHEKKPGMLGKCTRICKAAGHKCSKCTVKWRYMLMLCTICTKIYIQRVDKKIKKWSRYVSFVTVSLQLNVPTC